MTATAYAKTNNNQPPGVPLLLAHSRRSLSLASRAMGNGREQAGGVSIYDAREVRE